jgi:hypothetical protein
MNDTDKLFWALWGIALAALGIYLLISFGVLTQ